MEIIILIEIKIIENLTDLEKFFGALAFLSLWYKGLFCYPLIADDTNLLCLSNTIKKLNKIVNADLKHLVNWLNANKISLNVKETEMVIFKSNQKKFKSDFKKNMW